MLYVLGGWAGSVVGLWLWMTAAGAVDVSNVRKQEQNACNIAIENTIHDLGKLTDKRVSDALQAGTNIVIDDDIDRLCQGSASCRDKR